MKSRKDIAEDYLLEERGVDYITDTRVAPGFVECVCSVGGDIVVYRVYEEDGNITVTER